MNLRTETKDESQADPSENRYTVFISYTGPGNTHGMCDMSIARKITNYEDIESIVNSIKRDIYKDRPFPSTDKIIITNWKYYDEPNTNLENKCICEWSQDTAAIIWYNIKCPIHGKKNSNETT